MNYLIPSLSFLLCFILGRIITSRLSVKLETSAIFWDIILGTTFFTGINYFSCLVFNFPNGIYIAQTVILIFIVLYFLRFRSQLKIFHIPKNFNDFYLLTLLTLFGIILGVIFYTHIIPTSKTGDLVTGESTYGDLPFHLTNITQIAYGGKFPLDNPFYTGLPLVYPYLINFFSAILVYEGLPLKDSIIWPGIVLSLCLVGLVYDFALAVTKKRLYSFLATIFFLLNGGLGFYFFLSDYSFNISLISSALLNPTSLKEYSHLFDQNIQWANFLSRMIVPERSILFGIPVGIIVLRILYFRDKEKVLSWLDIVVVSFLISLMPLLHTHTFLVLGIILPPLLLFNLFQKEHFKIYFKKYLVLAGLSIYFLLPHLHLFLNHVGESNGFLRIHFGWMTKENESFLWFWFKNTYLYIPISLLVLLLPQIKNSQVKFLQVLALALLFIVNIVLLSPFDWDNVKFFFWIGLFFAIGAGTLLGYLLEKKNLFIGFFVVIISFTLIATSLLSIYREIFVSNTLFSEEAVLISEAVKKNTPPQATFLTYKLHNSPISNLAGRAILMGYPGSLWVHGINYHKREEDINQIFAGGTNTDELLKKHQVDYVVLESYTPNDLTINREYFKKFPLVIYSNHYQIYQIK